MKALISSEGLPPIRLHTQGGDFLEETHFLHRGDPNQKDGVATPGFLQVLMRAAEGEALAGAAAAGARTPYRAPLAGELDHRRTRQGPATCWRA